MSITKQVSGLGILSLLCSYGILIIPENNRLSFITIKVVTVFTGKFCDMYKNGQLKIIRDIHRLFIRYDIN